MYLKFYYIKFSDKIFSEIARRLRNINHNLKIKYEKVRLQNYSKT